MNHSRFLNGGIEINVTHLEITLQGKVCPPNITNNKQVAFSPGISLFVGLLLLLFCFVLFRCLDLPRVDLALKNVKSSSQLLLAYTH